MKHSTVINTQPILTSKSNSYIVKFVYMLLIDLKIALATYQLLSFRKLAYHGRRCLIASMRPRLSTIEGGSLSIKISQTSSCTTQMLLLLQKGGLACSGPFSVFTNFLSVVVLARGFFICPDLTQDTYWAGITCNITSGCHIRKWWLSEPVDMSPTFCSNLNPHYLWVPSGLVTITLQYLRVYIGQYQ